MKRWLIRFAAVIALLVFIALAGLGFALWGSLADLDATLSIAGLEDQVAVERDADGVVTITAQNKTDLAAALGFVHGQERFFQMDLQRRRAAGELSALFGEMALDLDKRTRRHRFRQVAQQAVNDLPTSHRNQLAAYTRGVNAGLDSLSVRPPEYLALGEAPAPFTEEDGLLTVFSMVFTLQESSGATERTLRAIHETLPAELAHFLTPMGNAWDAPIDNSAVDTPPIPSPLAVDLRNGHFAGPHEPIADVVPNEVVPGSNSWAVAGSHTATGAAMLANDMHLGHGVPNLWFRVRLVIPGQLDAVGVSLPGAPALVVGSNRHVAWGFTNSYIDYADVVLLEVEGDQYLTPEGPEEFVVHSEVIAVKDGDPVEHPVRWTRWGPYFDDEEEPFAYRWVPHDAAHNNLRLLDLVDAQTLEQALEVANGSGIPGQNILVASKDGRIGWTIAGLIPERSRSGRFPSYWHEQGPTWTNVLPVDQVPRVVDPPNGKLWTANNRIVGGDALSRIGDGGYALGARSKQIRDALLPLQDVTESDLLAIMLDDRALFLEPWRGLLEDVLAQRKAEAPFDELAAVLTEWTGHADPDDAAYALVRVFRGKVLDEVLNPMLAPCTNQRSDCAERGLQMVEGSIWKLVTEQPPHLLPLAFQTWDDLLADAALDARSSLLQSAPSLGEATWGVVNRVEINHPLGRAVPQLQHLLNMEPMALPGDSNMPRVQGQNRGQSERLVVSPGRESEGIFHMPTGQSGHFLSPFYRAGHQDWVEGNESPLLPGETAHRLVLRPG